MEISRLDQLEQAIKSGVLIPPGLLLELCAEVRRLRTIVALQNTKERGFETVVRDILALLPAHLRREIARRIYDEEHDLCEVSTSPGRVPKDDATLDALIDVIRRE